MASDAGGVAPEVEFDHHSVEYSGDWPVQLSQLRANCPIAHSPAHGGFWVVTRYEDVAKVIYDDVVFSSRKEADDPRWPGVNLPNSLGAGAPPSVPLEVEFPEFLAYRRLLMPFFTPVVVQNLEPVIRKWAVACVDSVIETGVCDFVSDITSVVPALVTCEYIGVPVEEWESFAHPAHEAIYAVPGSAQEAHAREGIRWMTARIFELILDRRRRPRTDLISTLVRSEIAGRPLDDATIHKIVELVIFGGFDTTSALICQALVYLSTHPGDRQRLIDDPALIATACEEFLRYVSPTQTLGRTVTRETVVAGCDVPQYGRILMSLASANRDPDVFDEPDSLILDRSPNRHMAFGLGAHRCLGLHFARAEFAAVVTEVLARMPDYAIDHEHARRYDSIGIVNGYINVPATFTASTRSTQGVALPGR